MCNVPAMPYGARGGIETKPAGVGNLGTITPSQPLGVSLDNLPSIGQRQLSLPTRFINGVALGQPRDISRQVQ